MLSARAADGAPVDDEIGGHGAFSIIDEPDLDRGTDSGF
jgi:hypothetical protein